MSNKPLFKWTKRRKMSPSDIKDIAPEKTKFVTIQQARQNFNDYVDIRDKARDLKKILDNMAKGTCVLVPPENERVRQAVSRRDISSPRGDKICWNLYKEMLKRVDEDSMILSKDLVSKFSNSPGDDSQNINRRIVAGSTDSKDLEEAAWLLSGFFITFLLQKVMAQGYIKTGLTAFRPIPNVALSTAAAGAIAQIVWGTIATTTAAFVEAKRQASAEGRPPPNKNKFFRKKIGQDFKDIINPDKKDKFKTNDITTNVKDIINPTLDKGSLGADRSFLDKINPSSKDFTPQPDSESLAQQGFDEVDKAAEGFRKLTFSDDAKIIVTFSEIQAAQQVLEGVPNMDPWAGVYRTTNTVESAATSGAATTTTMFDSLQKDWNKNFDTGFSNLSKNVIGGLGDIASPIVNLGAAGADLLQLAGPYKDLFNVQTKNADNINEVLNDIGAILSNSYGKALVCCIAQLMGGVDLDSLKTLLNILKLAAGNIIPDYNKIINQQIDNMNKAMERWLLGPLISKISKIKQGIMDTIVKWSRKAKQNEQQLFACLPLMDLIRLLLRAIEQIERFLVDAMRRMWRYLKLNHVKLPKLQFSLFGDIKSLGQLINILQKIISILSNPDCKNPKETLNNPQVLQALTGDNKEFPLPIFAEGQKHPEGLRKYRHFINVKPVKTDSGKLITPGLKTLGEDSKDRPIESCMQLLAQQNLVPLKFGSQFIDDKLKDLGFI